MSENSNHSTPIHEELRSVAPLLAGLPKEAPFRVPEGYFEALPERALRNARMSATVPDGYFEALPQQVLARVREGKPEANVVPMWRSAMRWVAAAVVVGMAVSIALWRPWQAGVSQDVQPDELALYFSYNLHHVDDRLLLEAGFDPENIDLAPFLNVDELPEEWLNDIDLLTIEDLSL